MQYNGSILFHLKEVLPLENNCPDSSRLTHFSASANTPTYPQELLYNSRDILTSQLALQSQYDELESCFLMKNSPPFCQKILYYIEKYLDSQDYSASPIYDNYPSRATIESMVDVIYMEMKDDAPDTLKSFEMPENNRYTTRSTLYMLIHPLLLNELYKRRMRKYIYTLCCSPPSLGYPSL
jgi:hypothetical protein